MPKQQQAQLSTLLDLLPLMERRPRAEAVRYNNGYRTFVWTASSLMERIRACGSSLTRFGLRRGDRIVLWGENRPEWMAAFWAAVAKGLQVVPIDPGASPRFVRTVLDAARPGLLVHSELAAVDGLEVPTLSFEAMGRLPPAESLEPAAVRPDDPAELVFTSGTTGSPKGIVHTHENICADLRPLQGELASFSTYLPLLRPLRILSILPLSHMFGQALGLFVPVLLGGTAVLVRELSPRRLIELVHKERAAALVTVPGQLAGLQGVLESQHGCSQRMPESPRTGYLGFFLRWLRFRDVHARFGWKFLALVVGGAQLRPALERWWSQLGFLVVQGYGLTEASPVVSMNNPLQVRSGSLGKVLEGQSVRIAEDGEILVRGANVARYFGDQAAPDSEAWLRTGDIGRLDEEGNLYFLGRKKDLIVTPEGQNVHPEDVEAVLLEMPEITDCAVVGKVTERGTEVHAVFPSQVPAEKAEAAVPAANARLERYQRIRSWSIWSGADLPRTPSTGKVKRRLVAEGINQGREEPEGGAGHEDLPPVERLLSRFLGADAAPPQDEARLGEDLGLSSLDRVELLSLLEQELGIEVTESALGEGSTVKDLKALAQTGRPGGPPSSEPSPSPTAGAQTRTAGPPTPQTAGTEEGPPGLPLSRWSRRLPSRLVRAIFQEALLLPGFRLFMGLTVSGRSRLDAVQPPVLFAANHTSHLDTLAVLDALPRRWRRRLAPAMAQEYFQPLLDPATHGRLQRLSARTQLLLLRHLLNAYPLPQRMGGIRRVLRFTGELAEAGLCPLIYPEGSRTPDGRIQAFQPGVGLMAKQLGLPVVPIRIEGLFRLYSKHDARPKPGQASLRFGDPVFPSAGTDPPALASLLERRIRSLGGEAQAEGRLTGRANR